MQWHYLVVLAVVVLSVLWVYVFELETEADTEMRANDPNAVA